MAKIDELFRMMAEQGASDLHLIAGQPPALRIDGELERIAGQAVLTAGHPPTIVARNLAGIEDRAVRVNRRRGFRL